VKTSSAGTASTDATLVDDSVQQVSTINDDGSLTPSILGKRNSDQMDDGEMAAEGDAKRRSVEAEDGSATYPPRSAPQDVEMNPVDPASIPLPLARGDSFSVRDEPSPLGSLASRMDIDVENEKTPELSDSDGITPATRMEIDRASSPQPSTPRETIDDRPVFGPAPQPPPLPPRKQTLKDQVNNYMQFGEFLFLIKRSLREDFEQGDRMM
jgi:hypothetical protein